MTPRVLTLVLLALALPARAEVTPRPGTTDGRIQAIDYNAEDVVLLRVPIGYQLTIEFAQDERIENVSIGDSAAWQVAPNRRGDHLFVKPIQPGVRTNMVAVTDARTYAFSLVPADSPAPDVPFTVRFRYPAAVATEIAPAAAPGRYKLKGVRALRPGVIGDDGQRTRMSWPAEVPQPAVFAVDASGQETLVNGHVEDGMLVIEGVAARYVFRLGKELAQADRVAGKAR